MIPHPKKEVNQKTSVSLDEVSPMRRQEFHPSIQRGLTSKKEKEQNFFNNPTSNPPGQHAASLLILMRKDGPISPTAHGLILFFFFLFTLLFTKQISGHNWMSNCDVSTTGWRRKFQSSANYRISSGVGLKWSWTTAKTLTSSQRVCRPATRSKSKSKLNPIGHQPPPNLFSFSLPLRTCFGFEFHEIGLCARYGGEPISRQCFPLKPKQELVMNKLLPYNNMRPRLVVHLVRSSYLRKKF